jgi:predicted enzyme related to lactoylglutathione lyase
MAKAIGVGGVFLKARDPQALAAWYAEHLGIQTLDGVTLVFSGPETTGMTVFAHFPLDSDKFGDGGQQAMVNFRVDDLEQLLAQLASAGVRIDPKCEDHPYGRFAWIWDLEVNRVELWEPAAAQQRDALFGRLRIQPRSKFPVTALPRKICGGFACVTLASRIGAIRKKQFHQVTAIGDRGGKNRRESARLGSVDWSAVLEQQRYRLRILAQRQHRMERLIFLRILAHRFHGCTTC